RDLVQARTIPKLLCHRVVLAQASWIRYRFRAELVAGLTVQQLDLEAGLRPGDGEALTGRDLAVSLRGVGALAPVHAALRRFVGEGEAAAGSDHVGDQLLGLRQRRRPGLRVRTGLAPACPQQLRVVRNVPVLPVPRR